MLFDKRFPREVGLPNRVGMVRDKDELQEFVNQHFHTSDLYTTVYAFKEVVGGNDSGRGLKPRYESAIIDKLYFDFDPEPTGEWFEDAKQFIHYLQDQDFKHTHVFSGGGIHVYVKTITHRGDNDLNNQKAAITTAQEKLIEKSGITRTDENGNEYHHVDDTVIGDVSQLTRIPNTFNHKDDRKRYCIPVYPHDIEEGLDHLKNKASQQNGPVKWYGKKVMRLNAFDTDEPMKASAIQLEDGNFKPSMGYDWDEINWDPVPCLVESLKSGTPNNFERLAIILYMKDMGVSYESCLECLQKHLTEHKYQHALHEGGPNGTPHYLYASDYGFPKHSTLVRKGICKDEGCCTTDHVHNMAEATA